MNFYLSVHEKALIVRRRISIGSEYSIKWGKKSKDGNYKAAKMRFKENGKLKGPYERLLVHNQQNIRITNKNYQASCLEV